MPSPAWMPLYVADYLADTGHLGALEHGAYLMLIMHYWRAGELPADDVALARIARTTPKEWGKVKSAVLDFFTPDMRHARIDSELAQAEAITDARRAAGRIGGKARAKQMLSGATGLPQANGRQSVTQSQSPLQKNPFPNGKGPESPDAELYRRGKEVLGGNSGGMIRKLIKAKGGDIALARAALETASTKANRREYIGAIISSRERDLLATDDFIT